MEIGGLPLHPLVVHLVVVLAPTAALVASVFALVPRWRWVLRWPAALLALAAAVSSWVARLSGGELLEARPFLLDADPLRTQVENHQEWGELLSLLAVVLAILVVLAAFVLPGTSPLADGRGVRESRLPAGASLLVGAVVLASLAVLVVAVLTGDSGARAVWG